MTRWMHRALLAVTTAAACRERTTAPDAHADVPVIDHPDVVMDRPDAPDVRDDGMTDDWIWPVADRPPDTLAYWNNGTYILPRIPVTFRLTPDYLCASAQSTNFGGLDPYAEEGCVLRGWFYSNVGGELVRTSVGDGSREILQERGAQLYSRARCAAPSLWVIVGDDLTREYAIVEFSDVSVPGIVRWRRSRLPDLTLNARPNFVATDQFIAWTWNETAFFSQIWIAGPHGETPHPLVDTDSGGLHASGSRMVFMNHGDIWLWNVGDAAPENLTHDDPEQWSPWVDGDRVVFIDQQYEPSGTIDNPNNPEVVMIDLRDASRTRVRITHDPPSRPAAQASPTVSGNWVLWTDARNSATPNRTHYASDHSEIWGYDLRTGRERVIIPGPVALNQTTWADRLWFLCTERGHVGIVNVAPMPP